MRIHRLFLGCVLIALSGCATKPPMESAVRMVPGDRVYVDASQGDSTIQVTRDKGFLGSACYIAVYLDGKKMAALASGERVAMKTDAGHHIVGAWSTGHGLCGIRDGKDRKETDASVNAGEIRKYRITINADLAITPTTL